MSDVPGGPGSRSVRPVRGPVRGGPGQPARGRPPAHGRGLVRRRRLAPRDAPCLLRAQPLRPGPDRRHRHPRRARRPRGARGVPRRRPEPGRPRAVAHLGRSGGSRGAAPAAGRRRGALRGRPRRARRRREPLRRRGRGRPGDRRLRPVAGRRRLRPSRGRGRLGPRDDAREPRRRDPRTAGRRGRGGARVRGARRDRDVPPARVRPGADGDPGPRRRMVGRERRDDDLGVDAGAARGAALLLPPARRARAADPGRDAGHRWRVRSEGARPARGHVSHARGAEGAGADQVDRGPAGEPDVGGPVPPRARDRDPGLRRRRDRAGRRRRLRAGRRRVPDAVAGRDGRRRRHALPRAVPHPAQHVHDQGGVLEHRRADGVPRPVAVRVGRARGAPRPGRPPARDRPGRAAAAQPPASRRAPVREPRPGSSTTG